MNRTTKSQTIMKTKIEGLLREYERAHKVWMNTSVYSEAGKQAKEILDAARKRYVEAMEQANPTWIIC